MAKIKSDRKITNIQDAGRRRQNKNGQADKNSGKPAIAFGKVLREYRQKAHKDQEELARICGVSGNCISNWELGKARPDVSLIPTLCDALDMPLYDLFEMVNPCPMNRDEISLLKGYRALTPQNRRLVRMHLDAVQEIQADTRRENYRREFRPLPFHDCGLAAGFGSPIDGEPDTHTVFVRISPESCLADDIFPVNGQSMEPKYPDGSMVFIKRVDADSLRYGDVIACIVDGTPYVKVYEKGGLRSINPAFSTIRISDDDNVRLFGRVVGLVPGTDIATKEETKELLEVFADELR